MNREKSQIKFAKSEKTGELIGFVSRHSKTKKLKGVREDSRFGKAICVLAKDLKGKVKPNILYDVELKAMSKGSGFVVVSAIPSKFTAVVSTIHVPKSVYQVIITFGYKIIYFDPKDGRTEASRTIPGALKVLNARDDISDMDEVVREFTRQAKELLKIMEKEGFIVCPVQKQNKGHAPG